MMQCSSPGCPKPAATPSGLCAECVVWGPPAIDEFGSPSPSAVRGRSLSVPSALLSTTCVETIGPMPGEETRRRSILKYGQGGSASARRVSFDESNIAECAQAVADSRDAASIPSFGAPAFQHGLMAAGGPGTSSFLSAAHSINRQHTVEPLSQMSFSNFSFGQAPTVSTPAPMPLASVVDPASIESRMRCPTPPPSRPAKGTTAAADRAAAAAEAAAADWAASMHPNPSAPGTQPIVMPSKSAHSGVKIGPARPPPYSTVQAPPSPVSAPSGPPSSVPYSQFMYNPAALTPATLTPAALSASPVPPSPIAASGSGHDLQHLQVPGSFSGGYVPSVPLSTSYASGLAPSATAAAYIPTSTSHPRVPPRTPATYDQLPGNSTPLDLPLPMASVAPPPGSPGLSAPPPNVSSQYSFGGGSFHLPTQESQRSVSPAPQTVAWPGTTPSGPSSTSTFNLPASSSNITHAFRSGSLSPRASYRPHPTPETTTMDNNTNNVSTSVAPARSHSNDNSYVPSNPADAAKPTIAPITNNASPAAPSSAPASNSAYVNTAVSSSVAPSPTAPTNTIPPPASLCTASPVTSSSSLPVPQFGPAGSVMPIRNASFSDRNVLPPSTVASESSLLTAGASSLMTDMSSDSAFGAAAAAAASEPPPAEKLKKRPKAVHIPSVHDCPLSVADLTHHPNYNGKFRCSVCHRRFQGDALHCETHMFDLCNDCFGKLHRKGAQDGPDPLPRPGGKRSAGSSPQPPPTRSAASNNSSALNTSVGRTSPVRPTPVGHRGGVSPPPPVERYRWDTPPASPDRQRLGSNLSLPDKAERRRSMGTTGSAKAVPVQPRQSLGGGSQPPTGLSSNSGGAHTKGYKPAVAPPDHLGGTCSRARARRTSLGHSESDGLSSSSGTSNGAVGGSAALPAPKGVVQRRTPSPGSGPQMRGISPGSERSLSSSGGSMRATASSTRHRVLSVGVSAAMPNPPKGNSQPPRRTASPVGQSKPQYSQNSPGSDGLRRTSSLKFTVPVAGGPAVASNNNVSGTGTNTTSAAVGKSAPARQPRSQQRNGSDRADSLLSGDNGTSASFSVEESAVPDSDNCEEPVEPPLSGNDLFKLGRYEEAIEAYSSILQTTTDKCRTLSNRSAAYCEQGEFDLALLDAVEVIDIDPTWGKGYYRRGVALRGLGRRVEALEAFRIGYNLDPDSAPLQRALVSVVGDLQAATQDEDMDDALEGYNPTPITSL